MSAPAPSQLDFEQILPAVYNDNGQLRVDAEITANISAAQEVIISDVDDSIKIGDGSGHYVGVTAGALNVSSTGSATVSGTVSTNLNGLGNFQTSQYIVGTSAVQLTVTPLTNRTSLSIKVAATGNNAVYIGNSSGVTTSTGFPLFNGDSIQLDLTPSHVIYVISGAASQTAYVIEVGT